jgi:uncharacterized FAD-dependent dehydrogenase
MGTEAVDCLIVGSGPAALGAAFAMAAKRPGLKITIIEQEGTSTGGLRNDCKMNFTYPIGFPVEYWSREDAESMLNVAAAHLKPSFMANRNLPVYGQRAARLGVELVEIRQAHLGTDGGMRLIKELTGRLQELGVKLSFHEQMLSLDPAARRIVTGKGERTYRKLIIAPGRKGFAFLQDMMEQLGIPYVDNVVDIGVRLELPEAQYPIVGDYYDPKFLFPGGVRTFCTNSRRAYVVKEKYRSRGGRTYFSVNGHAFSDRRSDNGMVNFALLKTVRFTEPLASGQEFAEMLGLQAMLMGGGRPLMQRVGDFRLGTRSKAAGFSADLYNFEPSLKTCTPGDISLAMPARILRAIWKSMKLLDTIVPGVMHPSTIMYYPEIKLYANKPRFLDDSFQAAEDVYMVGDGAGTSRGITAAWASGVRAAEGILKALD